jgi:hypothetical protein
MLPSIRRSFTETQFLVSLRPPRTSLLVHKKPLSKTMRLISSKSISAESSQSCQARASPQRPWWFSRTRTPSDVLLQRSTGILRLQPISELVFLMLCFASSRCLLRCLWLPTSGIWTIQTPQRRPFYLLPLFVQWYSITRTQKSWLVVHIMVPFRSSIRE